MFLLASTILLASLSVAWTAGICPDGWVADGTTCYAVLVRSFRNALDAESACHLNNSQSQLATIATSTSESLIIALLHNASISAPGLHNAYIGMGDIAMAGNFTWFDGSSVAYSNLSSTEAGQQFLPGAGRCVVMHSSDAVWNTSHDNVTWTVVPCCFQLAQPMSVNAVVCSKPPVASPASPLSVHCQGGCAAGWYKWNGVCYMARNTTQFSTTFDARQICFTLGGELPTINDATADSVLTYVLNNSLPGPGLLPPSPPVSVYIGVNSINYSSTRVQLEGTSAINYTNWPVGEPNAATGNCTQLSLVTATQNNWKATPCCASDNVNWIACQKPETSNVTALDPDNNVFAKTCYQAYNECLSNPCVSSATCVDHVTYYNCVCPNGYSGLMCNIATNFCGPNPCLHGATCRSTPQVGYTCTCPTGYSGTNCETITDPCVSSPCQNNGTCTTGTNNYTCQCLSGTSGTLCETNYDDCPSLTCLHGGTCVDHIGYASCNCVPGFTGVNCSAAVACRWPKVVFNATLNWTAGEQVVGGLDNGKATYGFKAMYTCYEGHKFPDMMAEKTIMCDVINDWNETITACGLHCDYLPIIGNAQIANGNTAVGTNVNYTCDVGFILPDNTTKRNTTCLADRTWTDDLANVSCHIRRCSELPVWPHQTLDTFNNTYNTTVTFWCDVGYVLFDNTTARTIKCLADGNWTADLPPCLPVVCPRIQLPGGVTRNTTANTYMTYAQYSCSSNNRMKDGSTYRTILCDATAEWSDNITDCRADRCFPLPYVANATPSTTDADYWTISRLTCIKGHKFFKDGNEYTTLSMTCQSNGWWNPILTACEPILCDPVPTAINIVPSTTSHLYGTVVDYKCLRGHYVYPKMPGEYNSLSIECLETKQWNNTIIPNCYPTYCSPPPDIVNGTRALPANNNFNYTASVYYECAPSYKFLDGRTKKNIVCDEFGNWNDTDVSCRIDRCDPVNITFFSQPDTTNTSWDTTVTYGCIIGYEWPKTSTVRAIKCIGGVWNDSFEAKNDCTIKYCDPVEVMGNATANSTDHFYNTCIDYRCNIGFKYSDNTTEQSRRCDENAKWTRDPFPTCNIIHCPSLVDVENATRDSNETYYNKFVTYSCLPGYQFPDKTKQKQMRCTENETWTDYPPACEVVFCPPLPYWSDTQFNSTDNNFLSVVTYWCNDGYKFKGYPAGNGTVLSSMCIASKQWYPAILDCQAESAINADIKGKTYDSPQAVSIGTVACTVMCVVMAAVVLLDASKLIADLKLMKENVRSLLNARSNKVQPGGP